MDIDRASNDTLRAIALSLNLSALRLETRAAGKAIAFGAQEEIDGLRDAADVLAHTASEYSNRVLVREGVTTEEEIQATVAAMLRPPAPESEGKPKKSSIFGKPW